MKRQMDQITLLIKYTAQSESEFTEEVYVDINQCGMIAAHAAISKLILKYIEWRQENANFKFNSVGLCGFSFFRGCGPSFVRKRTAPV